MSEIQPSDIAGLYRNFQAPIAALDCGARCAPYNERSVPFCCDPGQVVPTVHTAEWEYLSQKTDLWREWHSEDLEVDASLRKLAPDGQLLVVCKGASLCQRGFRSLSCRSFPFFPYLTRQGAFIGLSYYWEYEDRCWVISNLKVVSPEYRQQFIDTFDQLFEQMPEERENFRSYSSFMRQVFGRRRRTIPLLHRNGKAYKITPRNGRMRPVAVENLPKFGPYQLASLLPFSDEDPEQD